MILEGYKRLILYGFRGSAPVPEPESKKKKKTIKERKRKKKEKENLKESMVVQKGEMRQEWDRSKLSNEKRKSEM